MMSMPGDRLAKGLRGAGVAVGLGLMSTTVAMGQVSLGTAVELALSHSPKVRIAQADVVKAHASMDEAHDVFVPSVTAGAGLGNSYGYSPNPPTLFTFNAQSLVYNFSQQSYIRAARFGMSAADFSLQDARQGVMEDTALTFLAVQHDQEREAVLAAQSGLTAKLVEIVEDRLEAGRDTSIDLTTAKLSAAQVKLAKLRAEDDTARDRTHLALVMGLPPDSVVQVDAEFPATPVELPAPTLVGVPATPAVAAAFETADAKWHTAIGDKKYLYRPQLSLLVQYNRYATFTNSFAQLQSINTGIKIGANEGVFAIQIQMPLFDKEHGAKARESAAEAMRAKAVAEDAQITAIDGQAKLRHSIAVLQANYEVAGLQQELAKAQLEAVDAQLSASAGGNAPLMTPKDEQNSKISEREKYLAVLDANYQLKQAQVNLLRASDRLEGWIRAASRGTATVIPR